MSEEPTVEDRFFATFEKHDKFVVAQNRFLELCSKTLTSEEDEEAEQLLKSLSLIVLSPSSKMIDLRTKMFTAR